MAAIPAELATMLTRLRQRIRTYVVIEGTAMLLVLIVYAAAVFAIVRINASHALDDRIRGDFRWASEMSQQRPDGSLVWFDGNDSSESPWLQVWSPEGQPVFRTALAERRKNTLHQCR